MRWLQQWFAAAMLMMLAVAGSSPARAAGRVALVIGIDNYAAVSSLDNPVRDARLVAAALRSVGFDVTELTKPTQVTREGLVSALSEFRARAQGAEAAVVYFAGHGVEVNGHNWLFPADVVADSPDDLEPRAIKANWASNSVRGATRVRLVILDACRDNPFSTRPGWSTGGRSLATRGLNREAGLADNVVLLLATQPGEKAADGKGANSPFAAALAAVMKQPDLQLAALPARISQAMRATDGITQRPDQQGIFDEPDWRFRPTAIALGGGGSGAVTFDMEGAARDLCLNGKSAVPCREFVRDWSTSRFANLARQKLNDYEEAERTAALAVQRQNRQEAAAERARPALGNGGAAGTTGTASSANTSSDGELLATIRSVYQLFRDDRMATVRGAFDIKASSKIKTAYRSGLELRDYNCRIADVEYGGRAWEEWKCQQEASDLSKIGKIVGTIRELCQETGAEELKTSGELLRCAILDKNIHFNFFVRNSEYVIQISRFRSARLR